MTASVLHGLSLCGKLEEKLRTLRSDVVEYQKEVYDSWCRDLQAGIRDKSLRYVLDKVEQAFTGSTTQSATS